MIVMNPMNEAWKLLKGNPAMRDAQGRAINHPAAMVYENLASAVNRPYRQSLARGKIPPRPSLRQGEQVSDVMDHQMPKQHPMSQITDMFRQEARDETSHDMAQGNDSYEVPNYGVERQ